MIFLQTIVVATLALVLSFPAWADFTGRVVGVADGDTVTVLDAGNVQHKVRLTGIDAPEQNQPYGNRSKQSLSDMVFDKTVTVESNKRDRYGRELGKVLMDGMDVNLEQIRRGMAWHYKAYQGDQLVDDRQTYSNAEKAAQAIKQGLWSEAAPVPPWQWRHGKRGNSRVRTDAPAQREAPRQMAGQGFTCGSKKACRQMSSCEEARFYLEQCGLNQIDGDNDGIPCEVICR